MPTTNSYTCSSKTRMILQTSQLVDLESRQKFCLRTIILIGLFCLPSLLLGQEKLSAEITGKIFVDSVLTENIHVINLTSRRGTTSDQKGEFMIGVALNDTLFFSAINVNNVQVNITEKILEKRTIDINLTAFTEHLEEISLRQHQLLGRLSVDVEKAPDSVFKVNREALDFSKMRFDDPNSPYFVMSGGNLLNLVSYVGKLFKDDDKSKGKEIEYQYKLKLQKAPEDIRKEFGDPFFVETLNIPKEKIDDFITYCKTSSIDHLYVQGRKVEVVDILLKERFNYLENSQND